MNDVTCHGWLSRSISITEHISILSFADIYVQKPETGYLFPTMADKVENITQNGDVAPPKSAKQLAKEAAKQAKLDKLKQKLEKQQATAPKKEKDEVNLYSEHMFLVVLNTNIFFCRKRKRKKR